jgi:hypothetical protein
MIWRWIADPLWPDFRRWTLYRIEHGYRVPMGCVYRGCFDDTCDWYHYTGDCWQLGPERSTAPTMKAAAEALVLRLIDAGAMC